MNLTNQIFNDIRFMLQGLMEGPQEKVRTQNLSSPEYLHILAGALILYQVVYLGKQKTIS
ncbi:hypothetical protein [Cesiribacter sp. SM1]|uniref:hypothetical protein n=1 Tax=Cesiribacter sp. SM1 TaxID=2861196 RepID=UPI001CD2CD4F|nr:hypothetical protein [Cesiribacter sp. SM1]